MGHRVMKGVNLQELVFIHIGRSLPRYALGSLELAAVWSGLEPHLLTNADISTGRLPKGVRVTYLDDFYDSSVFATVAPKISYYQQYKDELWLRCLERLFVLDQYTRGTQSAWVMHAELDQLTFRLDLLKDALLRLPNRGIFVPFHDQTRAVASVLFCNQSSSLTRLLEFAQAAPYFDSEMQLLAMWGQENPDQLFALPTLRSAFGSSRELRPSNVEVLGFEEVGGAVDAAQLGQWVGGLDPRNVPLRERPQTKFVDSPAEALLTSDELSKISFSLRAKSSSLEVVTGTEKGLRLYNLHLHSKIHQKLIGSGYSIDRLLADAALPYPTVLPGTRRHQLTNRSLQYAREVLRHPIWFIGKVTRRLKKLIAT